MMQRLTRRGAVKTGAAIAAALTVAPEPTAALPVASGDGQAPDLIHPAECFHAKYRAPVGDETATRRDQLSERLRASLTPEQWRMAFDLDALDGNSWIDEQDRFVDELARHFPGLAPAIRAVAYHHIVEQDWADRGRCCTEPRGGESDG